MAVDGKTQQMSALGYEAGNLEVRYACNALRGSIENKPVERLQKLGLPD
jgi:hypothetical protein